MCFLIVTKASILLGLLGLLFSSVVAHDHGEMQHHGHGATSDISSGANPFVNDIGAESNTGNYISYPEARSFLYAHAAVMVVSWLFVMPIALALGLSKSRYHYLAQVVFLASNTVGIVLAMIYNSQTPDLYPNNAHHKLGWIIACLLVGHFLMGLFKVAADSISKSEVFGSKEERSSFIQLSKYSPETESLYRASADSGLDIERDSSSDTLVERDSHHLRWNHQEGDTGQEGQEEEGQDKHPENLHSTLLARIYSILQHYLPLVNSPTFSQANDTLYSIILRSFVILGFMQLCLGLVTATGMFMGNSVFNGLAHFIKGGIFFLYGVLCLGRWLGAFGEIGWAWNVKPPSRSSWADKAPTAEMVESSVIFLYGLPNIFLEHLAAWGKEWSHGDLEHLAIAILFFGGGLAGILVELKSIRNFLDVAVADRISSLQHQRNLVNAEELTRKQRLFFNPFPALVVFVVGQVMGSHHQDSVFSTVIHAKWGLLLSCAGIARLATYVLLYLSPPKSYLPARPLTELIASGCLMSGGLLFIASNRDTVNVFDQKGYDPGFLFTLTVGLTAVLMSWITVVMAIKALGSRR